MDPAVYQFERELGQFIKISIAKYGYSVINQWREENKGECLLPLYYKYRSNLDHVFRKYQKLESGMIIYLESMSLQPYQHIEGSNSVQEIWVDEALKVKIHVNILPEKKLYQVVQFRDN